MELDVQCWNGPSPSAIPVWRKLDCQVGVMTSSPSATCLTRQFDDFLFARIDEGSDATPLSVLSMLARLDIDPWEEAAKLARLPRAAAARRLVDCIAATPGAPSAYLNVKTVSDKLLSLLPSPVLPRQEHALRALKQISFVWPPVLVFLVLAISLIVMNL
jgi:hypothetical protein